MEKTEIIITGLVEGKMTELTHDELEIVRKYAMQIELETGKKLAICNFHVNYVAIEPKSKA